MKIVSVYGFSSLHRKPAGGGDTNGGISVDDEVALIVGCWCLIS